MNTIQQNQNPPNQNPPNQNPPVQNPPVQSSLIQKFINEHTKEIVVAVITVIIGPILINWIMNPSSTPPFFYQVRVEAQGTNEVISSAQVTIEVTNQPAINGVTDSNGLAVIPIDANRAGESARLIITANNYKRYRENIILIEGSLPDVILLEPVTDKLSLESSPTVKPGEPTEISIIYAPEEEIYMIDAIERFNQTYEGGNNPLTGESLAQGIHVTGTPGSSGQVAQGITNAIGNQHCPKWLSQETLTPTIFSPSVRHWLALVNYCAGKTIFDLNEEISPATARVPVVMAIWESRLEAIKVKNGGQSVGWEELLEVLNSPNGWADYGFESGHQTVYYGHTDPEISSTALSTLISEFYAIARTNDEVGVLELDEVNDANVQQGVRDIEQLIRHYAPRNTEFINYIAQGPDYVDFVALEENDLIKINRGETGITPPEKLVALYPKEGTFWHDHPFAIPQADWVTFQQREAAKLFTEFVRSEEVQQKVLASGFRPVIELEATTSTDPNINPIVPDLGVDPEQPTVILQVPEPQVIAAIQASWPNVKKRADVILAIDTSESMEGNKITQAQEAAQIFLQNMSDANRVGLIDFNDTAEELVSLDFIEGERDELRSRVGDLKAEGKTALYDGIVKAVNILKNSREPEDDRIQAVIVLSDGEDTGSENDIQQVLDLINENRNDRNPIVVIPIAYGYKPEQTNDLDCDSLGNNPEPDQVLQCIAQASTTLVESGNPESIKELLKILSGYF